MYKFSKTSLTKLSSCHEDLQFIFIHVIDYIDCKVLEGHRSSSRQLEMFEMGLSKKKWPDSLHNKSPSMAIDVAPYPIDWKDTKRFYYLAGIVKGIAKMLLKKGMIEHDIRWGGDWDSDNDLNDQHFMDLVHFELVKVEK